MIKLLTALFLAFSLFGCGTTRPHIQNCIVNAPLKHRVCYYVDTDYNEDGTLKATAVPVIKPNVSLDDLNKFFVVDSDTGPEDGLAGLKAWIKDLLGQATTAVKDFTAKMQSHGLK